MFKSIFLTISIFIVSTISVFATGAGIITSEGGYNVNYPSIISSSGVIYKFNGSSFASTLLSASRFITKGPHNISPNTLLSSSSWCNDDRFKYLFAGNYIGDYTTQIPAKNPCLTKGYNNSLLFTDYLKYGATTYDINNLSIGSAYFYLSSNGTPIYSGFKTLPFGYPFGGSPFSFSGSLHNNFPSLLKGAIDINSWYVGNDNTAYGTKYIDFYVSVVYPTNTQVFKLSTFGRTDFNINFSTNTWNKVLDYNGVNFVRGINGLGTYSVLTSDNILYNFGIINFSSQFGAIAGSNRASNFNLTLTSTYTGVLDVHSGHSSFSSGNMRIVKTNNQLGICSGGTPQSSACFNVNLGFTAKLPNYAIGSYYSPQTDKLCSGTKISTLTGSFISRQSLGSTLTGGIKYTTIKNSILMSSGDPNSGLVFNSSFIGLNGSGTLSGSVMIPSITYNNSLDSLLTPSPVFNSHITNQLGVRELFGKANGVNSIRIFVGTGINTAIQNPTFYLYPADNSTPYIFKDINITRIGAYYVLSRDPSKMLTDSINFNNVDFFASGLYFKSTGFDIPLFLDNFINVGYFDGESTTTYYTCLSPTETSVKTYPSFGCGVVKDYTGVLMCVPNSTKLIDAYFPSTMCSFDSSDVCRPSLTYINTMDALSSTGSVVLIPKITNGLYDTNIGGTPKGSYLNGPYNYIDMNSYSSGDFDFGCPSVLSSIVMPESISKYLNYEISIPSFDFGLFSFGGWNSGLYPIQLVDCPVRGSLYISSFFNSVTVK